MSDDNDLAMLNDLLKSAKDSKSTPNKTFSSFSLDFSSFKKEKSSNPPSNTSSFAKVKMDPDCTEKPKNDYSKKPFNWADECNEDSYDEFSNQETVQESKETSTSRNGSLLGSLLGSSEERKESHWDLNYKHDNKSKHQQKKEPKHQPKTILKREQNCDLSGVKQSFGNFKVEDVVPKQSVVDSMSDNCREILKKIKYDYVLMRINYQKFIKNVNTVDPDIIAIINESYNNIFTKYESVIEERNTLEINLLIDEIDNLEQIIKSQSNN